MKQGMFNISSTSFDKKDLLKYLMVGAIFILAGFVIFEFFPNINKFQYTYEKGSPWKYEEITSPFAFEIRKSKDDIEREEKELLEKFAPVYNYDATALQKSKKLLKEKFGQTDDATAPYYKYIESQLNSIYKKGIISAADMDEYIEAGTTTIRLVNEKVSKETPISNLLTTKTAYEKVINEAPASINRNTLRDYNISNYITENVKYDADITESMRKELLHTISLTKGQIQSGEKIIDRGDIITDEKFDILNSYKQEIEANNQLKNTHQVACGQAIVIVCALFVFFLYFFLFRKKFLVKKRDSAFMLSLVTIFCILTSCAVRHEVSPYVIPYALIPIVVASFFDTRTALFTHLTTVLLCSFVVPHEFEFLFLQVLIGMVSICTLKTVYQRSHLFRAGAIIFLAYIVLFYGFSLIHVRSMEQMSLEPIQYFFINGILLLFAYPLIYIIEKLFGYTSDATLVELANTNNELFRRFSEVAQATFNHCMQVSNLAEAAAKTIGANPMLVRTGALYHDIGKMNNPTFFTENQNGVNPHVELNDEEKSAQIIIHHVTDGIEIAKKYGLPPKIQDFIMTHHGRGKTTYFYNTFKNKYPDKEVDEAMFTYPGPNPFTKEQTILMMCDAVEAASRSLNSYTDKNINDLVEKIINNQLNEGLYNDSPITMKQIQLIKGVLKDKLKSLYHTRIVYPELKNKN